MGTTLYGLGIVVALSAGCAGNGQVTAGGDAGHPPPPPGDSGAPPEDTGTPPGDANVTDACSDACGDAAPLACPPGTALVDGQCDDVRCPDELSSATPSLVGLPTNANGWPRYRHDNRNSGWTRAKVAASPKVKWSKPLGLGVGAGVDPQGHVFAGGETANAAQGYFDSFDGSGSQVFSLLLGGTGVWDVTVPAVLTNGTSYLSTDDNGTGSLWAIAPDGTKTWTVPVPNVAEASPIVSPDGTLVYANDDHFYGLDPNGNTLWVTDPSAVAGSALGSNAGLAETCDGHIYAGTPKGWRAIDVHTGASLWTVPGGWMNPTLGSATSSPVVAADGTLYGIDSEGVGWAVSPAGTVLWRNPVGAAYGERISTAKLGNLVLGIANGSLIALDAATGTKVWTATGGFGAGPVIDGNLRVYVVDSSTVYAFDAAGTSLWTLPLGSGNSGAAELAIGPDGTIYAQTFDSVSQAGTVWAIQ